MDRANLDLDDIFCAAMELPSPAERAAYLDQVCGDDLDARRRLERLLAAHAQAGSFLGAGPSVAAATTDLPSQAIGTVIGRYKLLHQIGEGGMGVVYMAEQEQPVRRRVALKIIKPGMDSRQIIARFEAERQALAMMDHVNIARVLDAGATEAGRPYFVMELVNGVPITKYCDDNHLTPRERLELFVPVCQAIQHAHQKGIIHRDVKPSNVLVTLYDGKPVPKVIDFGVAKATEQKLTERTLFTQHGTMVGTLEYMSPEQAEMSALGVDTRSDIYSLGVLLYELLTGSTPLSHKRLKQAAYGEVLRIIKEEEPPKPSTRVSDSGEALASISAQRKTEPAKLSKLMRGELDWIVMKTLEKDRNRRYETANAFAADVERYLNDETVEACPPSASYRLRKFMRKNRVALTTAVTFVILLVAGAGISIWQAVRATGAEQVALVAAEAERTAKEVALKRLAQIEKGNEILGSIFKNLDPESEEKEGKSLRVLLGERLDAAVKQLEGEAVGDPVAVARLQLALGDSLLSLGYTEKAINLLTKARATCTSQLGPDHEDTLGCMNSLALGYENAGKPDLALPLFEETLKLSKANLVPDHRGTLTLMNNLATGYVAAGRLERALPLFEETLKLRKAKLGPDDLDILESMGNLSAGYLFAGKLDLALPLLEETLKLRKAKLGDSHPDTIGTMNNLAMAYLKTGRLDLALPMLEQSLKLAKAKWGPDHPNTLGAMGNLASGYQKSGKLDQALALLEETLKLNKAKLGPDHPDTLQCMSNLALGYWDAGKMDLSLPLFQQAVAEIEKRRFVHKDARKIVENLSAYHEQLKQFDQAETWRRKWLAVVKERAGAESRAYAIELARLGRNLLKQKKFADAELNLRESLAILQKQAPDDWLTFNSKSMLGGALLGRKKYADAEPLLVLGYEGMKQREAKTPVANGPRGRPIRLAEALERLVELYEATNQPEKARLWAKKRPGAWPLNN